MSRKNRKPWGTSQLILTALILSLLLATAMAVIFWQINEFTLNVTLNGPQDVVIEYGQTYDDPGAGAVIHGTMFMKEPVDVAITTQGQVNPDIVGTYRIRYTAKHTIQSIFGSVEVTGFAQRTVRVVDTACPVITLFSDPNTFTIPGEPYQEEGFLASDNYDGDLTDRVIRTATTEAVTYQVSDSSGNIARVERTIFYHDPIPPELTLLGEAHLSLEAGTPYAEPGYTATDNCDGDLTDQVVVSGTVDTTKAGTYILEYTVTDSYGNTVSATRTVEVFGTEPETESETQVVTESAEVKEKETLATESPAKNTRVEPKNPVGGVIYLTFDDGPGRHTPRLLKILDKYDAKASFFVVNTKFAGTIADIAAAGHTVAMHSASHHFKQIYASEEAFFEDLEQIQSIIAGYSGTTPMLMRFPGGSSNTVSRRFNKGIMTRLAALVEEQGYTYFDWNVDSDDAGDAATALQVYNNVVSGVATRKTSVVLLHDIKSYTVDAIEDILVWGQKNGYTFKALTDTSPTFHHTIRN